MCVDFLCCDSCNYCNQCTLKLINWSDPLVSHLLSNKVKPGLRNTEKVFLSPDCRGVPSVEIKDTKIMWTFLRDQILCPLNGRVPWTEVSQRRQEEMGKNLTRATDFAEESYEKISRISWERHLHALRHVSDLPSLQPSQILSYRFSLKSIFDLEGNTTERGSKKHLRYWSLLQPMTS